MKDNKLQQAAVLATGYGRQVPVKEAPQNSQVHAYSYNITVQPAYAQLQPIVKRYAIDDHGGGYQGL